MNRTPVPLTQSRLTRLLPPVNAFFATESAGGIVLLLSAITALVWANSPWSHSYYELWHTQLSVGTGKFSHSMSFQHWVNDGLMVVFFLLVGLEIKRELLIGELASRRRAALPVAAAVGGMIAPALIYVAINSHSPGMRGWSIPMATDIAFAVGVLALVSRSVPVSIKVFLLAIAIVDDLGAVLVIAFMYTQNISVVALGGAALFLGLLILLNIFGVHRPFPYIVLGVGLWLTTLYSGIHATIAGVLLALTIPATRQIEEGPYVAYVRRMLEYFEHDTALVPDRITEDQSFALKAMEEASQAVQTPLARIEHALLKPVNFFVMPVFALANAGLDLRSGVISGLVSPVSLGTLFGLLLGKPLGVLLATWLSLKIGIASMPRAATWQQIVGVAVLCGIGFTMSLFVANLALDGHKELLASAKIGILVASLTAGIVGGGIVALARSSQEMSERHHDGGG